MVPPLVLFCGEDPGEEMVPLVLFRGEASGEEMVYVGRQLMFLNIYNCIIKQVSNFLPEVSHAAGVHGEGW